MRTSLKARLGAIAATAAITTSGAMAASGVADAAVHPAVKRLPTTLSIHASAPVTRHHVTFARISGRLRSHHVGLRHKVVWLERRGPKGHWFVVQRERTHRHGVVVADSYLADRQHAVAELQQQRAARQQLLGRHQLSLTSIDAKRPTSSR